MKVVKNKKLNLRSTVSRKKKDRQQQQQQQQQQQNNKKTFCDFPSPLLQSIASYTLRIVYVLGSVHTMRFQKYAFPLSSNCASIGSRPRHCFDTFSTFHTNTICIRFHFDQFSRAFLNRCAFDENAQRISVDGRP